MKVLPAIKTCLSFFGVGVLVRYLRSVREDKAKREAWTTFFVVLLAFSFSVFCRTIWLEWASGQSRFLWNGSLMIATNDGYYFAEGARDLLNGSIFSPANQPNDLSPVHEGLSILTYFSVLLINFFVTILNFFIGICNYFLDFFYLEITPLEKANVDTIFAAFPAFFSSVVAIPLVLIGRELGSRALGLVAAVLASLSATYYRRTMAGFYDTDVLVIGLPCVLMYGFVRMATKKDLTALMTIFVSSAVSIWFYKQSFVICGAMSGLFLLYTLAFERKNKLFYLAFFLSLIGESNLFLSVKLLLAVAFFISFKINREVFYKNAIFTLIALSALALLATNDLIDMIRYRVIAYITRTSTVVANTPFYFLDVNTTISEVGRVNFLTIMRELCSTVPLFVMSMFGLFLLCIKRPVFLLSLPFLVLALISFKAGMRFIMYGVVPASFGLAYLFFSFYQMALGKFDGGRIFGYLNSKIPMKVVGFVMLCVVSVAVVADFYVLGGAKFNWTSNSLDVGRVDFGLRLSLVFDVVVACVLFAAFQKRKRGVLAVASVLLCGVCSVLSVNPWLGNLRNYFVGTVLHPNEIRVLADLKKRAGREDYVISWWDYGYPIRYYADTKTLVDGAKHSGSQNFAVSYIFLQSQVQAANLARLDVEYTEKAFRERSQLTNIYGTNLADIASDYTNDNINDLLNRELLRRDLKLPEKTRDVYIYIPQSIIRIARTVFLFSRRDITNGDSWGAPYYFGGDFKLENDVFKFNESGKFEVFKKDVTFKVNDTGPHKLNKFVTISYPNNKFKKEVLEGDPNSKYYAIHLSNYGKIFVMEKAVYESTFVKLFMLEEYDPELFEPVSVNAWAKVYKLKK